MLNNKVGCYAFGIYGIYFITKIKKLKFHISYAERDSHNLPIGSYKKIKLLEFLDCGSYDGRFYGNISGMFVQKEKNAGMLNVE
jgi:hypothetical protein